LNHFVVLPHGRLETIQSLAALGVPLSGANDRVAASAGDDARALLLVFLRRSIQAIVFNGHASRSQGLTCVLGYDRRMSDDHIILLEILE
jgi:hypothetical protein